MNDELLQWYEAAQRAGFTLIPITDEKDKGRPLTGWNKPGAKTLSPSLAVKRIKAGLNVGVGPNNAAKHLVVMDQDSQIAIDRHQAEGPPVTLSIKTPRGVAHLYSLPDGAELPNLTEGMGERAGIGELGLRLAGKYQVGPGSVVDERAYKAKKSGPPPGKSPWRYEVGDLAEVEEMPQGVIDYIKAAGVQHEEARGHREWKGFDEPWIEGERHAEAHRAAVKAGAKNSLDDLERACAKAEASGLEPEFIQRMRNQSWHKGRAWAKAQDAEKAKPIAPESIRDILSGKTMKERTETGGLFKDQDAALKYLNARIIEYRGSANSRYIDRMDLIEAGKQVLPNLLSKGSLLDRMSAYYYEFQPRDEEGKPKGEATEHQAVHKWLKDRKISRTHAERMELAETPNDALRLWSEGAVPILPHSPSVVIPDADCKPLEEYLLDVVANGDQETFQWVAQWLADIWQRPYGRPCGTALQLTGPQGTGKSMAYDVLMLPVLGQRLAVKVGRESFGRFNASTFGRALIGMDEAVNKYDPDLANHIKDLIMAQEEFRYEEKHQPVFNSRSVARLLFTTNYDSAVDIEFRDRRHTVLIVDRFSVEQGDKTGLAMRRAFFGRIRGWMQDHVPEMRGWLNAVNVDRERIALPLETDAKLSVQEESNPILSTLADAVRCACLPGGQAGFLFGRWLHDEWRDSNPRKAPSTNKLLKDACTLLNINFQPRQKDYADPRPNLAGETGRIWPRQRGVDLPSPLRCAKRLNAVLPQGQKIKLSSLPQKWLEQPEEHDESWAASS